MRVLIVHNQYQLAGGEDSVVRAEQALLEEHGHEVSLLLAHNKEIDGLRAQVAAAAGAIYSIGGKRRIARAIADFCPSVVHVHNFFPLFSPSIYDACKDAGVPVVQTLHNYRLACPGALFYRNGGVCESCLDWSIPLPGIVHGCYRGSKTQSAATALMIGAHRAIGTWHHKVDAFITLTQFQREKMIQAGLPSSKIHVKSNFVADPGRRLTAELEDGKYALYVGRLSEEKGVSTLVDSYHHHALGVPLKVVGEGPAFEHLRNRVREVGLEKKLEFLGRRNPDEIRSLMRGARFLVFPSVWYEGFPMVIAEALANSLPVIASQIGGVPEIVVPGESGWLVRPGDPDAWAAAIDDVWANPDEPRDRGRGARNRYEQLYSPEANYVQLMAIYAAVLS